MEDIVVTKVQFKSDDHHTATMSVDCSLNYFVAVCESARREGRMVLATHLHRAAKPLAFWPDEVHVAWEDVRPWAA